METGTFGWKHTFLACYTGYITQAIVNCFAPLLFLIFRAEFGLSIAQITFITTLNFVVQLSVDALSAGFADKVGYRRGAIAAHVFAVGGLVGMAVLPRLFPTPYPGLLTAVVLYAIGGGIIEVLISPIVEACPMDDKVGVMSLLHSFYCWGSAAVVLLSTLFLAVFGKSSWPILCCLWALIPAANGILFTKVPINTLPGDTEHAPAAALFKDPLFRIFFVLMIAAGASELSVTQWASAFAEGSLHITKAAGDIAGPCFFAVLMGLARVLHAKMSSRTDLKSVVRKSALLCIAAYLLIVLSPWPVLSLLGCGICGFSVGVFWPGTFSMAAEALPKGGTAMFALLALAGDIGCSSGPTLVGFVSGLCGEELKAGLFAATIFPVVLMVGVTRLMKENRNKTT